MSVQYSKGILGKAILFINSKIESVCKRWRWSGDVFTKGKGALHSFCSFLYGLGWYRNFIFKNVLFIPLKSSLTPLSKLYLFVYSVLIFMLLLFFLMVLGWFFFRLNVFFMDSKGQLKVDTLISMLSAIGTAFAAIYAAKSAKGVFLSNKSIESNNKAEAFDRVFSVLIEQHGFYLKKVNEFLDRPSGNYIFSVEYLSARNLSESINVLRGVSDIIYHENERYVIKHGELLWLNAMYHEQKANEEVHFLKTIIVEGNAFSKNVLSPYMRILYHLLKAINEAHNFESEIAGKKAKQYSNIIRSLIPNNVLFLIALNGADFLHYRYHIDSFGTEPGAFFNDYKKFYNLLIKYDFFEHLNVSGDDEDFAFNFFVFEPSKSILEHRQESFNRVRFLNGKKGVRVKESATYGVGDLMELIAKEIRKENTLLCLCYFYQIGTLSFRVKQYFRNKYIVQALSEIEDCRNEELRFTYYMIGADNAGKIVLLSDSYLEMLISGVVG